MHAPRALLPFRRATIGDRSLMTGLKACVGLAVGISVLSACGSTSAPSATADRPSAAVASVGPSNSVSAAPSVVATVPPTQAVVASMTPEATIAAPNVGWFASDGTTLWVVTGSGQVARLDPAADALGRLTTIDATHQDGGFAADKRGLWLNDFDANLVYRVDPSTLKIVARIATGRNPEGIALDARDAAVWVADHRGGTVERIDPATNKVVATISAGNTGPSGPHQIGVGLGSVWVGVPNTSSVYRIDPATNRVIATIEIPALASPCSGFAFSPDAVWTPSCQDATRLVRIDPATNKVAAMIKLDGYGDDPILIDGVPWLVVEGKSGPPARMVRINPATNTIDRIVALGDSFRGSNLVVAKNSVWAIDSANARILQLPLAAFK